MGGERLGSFFRPRRVRGEAGLPLMSVTMRDGLVARDELERRTETNLSDADHILVEPGDLAYNTMRMWQGAFGIADRRGNVSPAYVVMRPTKAMEPRFAWHWLKSDQALYRLWSYSYGLTDDRLRLYAEDFRMVPMAPPPLPEQRRIAAVLDAWDEAIALNVQLVAGKRRQRDGLRVKLIGEGRLLPLSELAQVAFSGVDKKVSADERPVRLCNYMDVLNNERIRDDLPFSEGSATEREVERFRLRNGDVIFTKDSETPDDIADCAVVEAPGDDLICGYHLAIARPIPRRAVGAYLAHAIRTPAIRTHFINRVNGVTRFGLTLEAIADILIPAPRIERQRSVAAVLDSLTDEIDLLATRNDLLRTQKRGLMQQLLTGALRVPESLDALLPAPPREAAE